MAHMKPLDPATVPDDIRERFEHYRKTRGFTPNSIRTMARRPDIVRAFMQLNQAVLYEGTVAEELKMLVSLISSQAAGCRYCQAHMANLSEIYKASKDKIAAVWDFESSDLFSNAERAALRVACYGAMSPSQATQENVPPTHRGRGRSRALQTLRRGAGRRDHCLSVVVRISQSLERYDGHGARRACG